MGFSLRVGNCPATHFAQPPPNGVCQNRHHLKNISFTSVEPMRTVTELEDELHERIVSANDYYSKLERQATKKYEDKMKTLLAQRKERIDELNTSYQKEITRRKEKDAKYGTNLLHIPLNRMSRRQREIVKESKECKARQDELLAREKEKKKQQNENPVAFAAAAKEKIAAAAKEEEVKKEEKRAEFFDIAADMFGFNDSTQEETKDDLDESEEEELAQINAQIARRKAEREAHAKEEALREHTARERMKQSQLHHDDAIDMVEVFKQTPLTPPLIKSQDLPPPAKPILLTDKRPVKQIKSKVNTYAVPASA